MSTFTPNTEGVFFGLEESVYRAAPGVANSRLKEIERSPAHYQAALAAPWETTPAKTFGLILHGTILEPERVLHVVRPEGLSFQTNAGKAWRDAQTLPIITVDDSLAITGAANAVRSHSLAMEIINRSEKEVSAFKLHAETGLLLKGRADLVFNDNSGLMTIADIKTTEDASPHQFISDAGKWAYYRQAAYYLDLFGATNFVFIAVEKSAPFGVSVLQYDSDAIQAGRDVYERNLRTLAECERSGHWPAYPETITPIGLPYWVKRSLAA